MGKPSKRRALKAALRKTAKRKAAVRSLPRGRFPPVPPEAPTYECLIPRVLYEYGIGNIVLARELPSGKIATVVFLLDVFCLGVKDVVLGVFGLSEYRERIHRLTADFSYEAVSPATVHSLVEGAVAYARRFGFPPHPDYEAACGIFAGIAPLQADRSFPYGKDGKPFYVSGPRDTLAKSRRVIAMLENACGPGEFDFMVNFGA
jgi:hypothetical protein